MLFDKIFRRNREHEMEQKPMYQVEVNPEAIELIEKVNKIDFNSDDLTNELENSIRELSGPLQWEEEGLSFEEFMQDKTKRLIFK